MKRFVETKRERALKSHPTRVRGLKQAPDAFAQDVVRVAPHVGAWIETVYHTRDTDLTVVAPHAGAWIETIFTSRAEGFPFSRTPRGCVD